MSKQDRVYTRTASELERKYNFTKSFAEIMGLLTDARDKVDSVDSKLRNDILEQSTTIYRDTEKIIMGALESKVEASELEELKRTIESRFTIMGDKISMDFGSTLEQMTDIDEDLRTVLEEIGKHFEFSADGMEIKAGAGSMSLIIDNDVIRFEKNGQQFGWWDGVNFHTGNIVINLEERAQFGNFAFVPRSNGSLDFLKVGG
jgi:hypothetical protein